MFNLGLHTLPCVGIDLRAIELWRRAIVCGWARAAAAAAAAAVACLLVRWEGGRVLVQRLVTVLPPMNVALRHARKRLRPPASP
jgi:hypothetical protein